MTIERERLLGIAQAEREAIGRTIQYTPPECWDQPSRLPGWRVRDLVAHLAATDRAAAAAFGSEPAAEVEEFLQTGRDLTVDGFNEFSVQRRAELPLRQVVAEWGRDADTALARAGAIPADEWTTRRVSWLAGEIPARFLIQSRVMEWWVHGEDIRAGADLEPRREHWPLWATNDLGIRTLPWALGLAGIRLEGRSMRFELDEAGGGSWHRGLGPREGSDPDRAPDAVVEGMGYSLALLASRRAPAATFIEDGSLVLAGDEDLARTVLSNIRAFT